MSKVEKLQIQGVRSFGNEAAAINIFSPLTLIVGYNGSGKTTIIECLKYATTGELPPNSKGGAFIHDPKLTGEKDQWAQVKLQFKATTGARMVITRNLQLLVKKATRQQKTMECNLVMSKDGEKTSISSRVAELDAIIPQYLGVSKAILENVIFCHQDDSLWPMSEPNNVKKRFDAIFEAEKYTKAVENIKQMRKKKREEMANLKIIEGHAREDKDRGERAKRKSSQLSREIEQLRDEIRLLENRAQEAGRNAQDARQRASECRSTIDNLVSLKKSCNILAERAETISKDLELRQESDEDLKTELDSHDQRFNDLKAEKADSLERSQLISDRIKHTQTARSERDIELGMLRQQRNSHEHKVKERTDIIHAVAQQNGIRGFESDLEDSQIDQFIARLTGLHEEQSARIEKLREDNAGEAQKIQELINNIFRKQSAAQQGQRSSAEGIMSNEGKIKSLQSELEEISLSNGQSSFSGSDLHELQEKLDKTQSEFEAVDWEAKLGALDSHLMSMEETSRRLDEELLASAKKSDAAARVDYLKRETKDKRRLLEALLEENGEQVESLFGHKIQFETIESDCVRVREEKREEVKRFQDIRTESERKLEIVNHEIKQGKDRLKRDEQELANLAQAIRTATDGGEPEEYTEILGDLQANRDTRADDVKSFEILKKWYSDCIATAKADQPACRLCKRAFDDNRTAERFIKNLEKQISTGTLEQLRNELKEMEKSLQATRNERGTYDRWTILKTEQIPTLCRRLETLQAERTACLADLETNDKSVQDSEDRLIPTEEILRIALRISDASGAIKNLQGQVNESLSNNTDDLPSRGAEDVKIEIDDIAQNILDLRSQQHKLRAEERQKRDAITDLTLELRAAETRREQVKAEANRRSAIDRQIRDLKHANFKLRETSNSCTEDIESLGPQMQREATRLNDVQSQGRQRERSLEQQAKAVKDAIDSIDHVSQMIRNYSDGDSPSKLIQCEKEVVDLGSLLVSLGAELKKVRSEIDSLQSDLSRQDEVKRVIRNNITLRSIQRELEKTLIEMERLSDLKAEGDEQRHLKDFDRWDKAQALALAERKGKLGTMKAKDDQLVELVDEWQKDYKDAPLKYKRAHIDVEINKAAIEDLGRYGSALDHAIMKYHSLKMEEINRIIEELWRRTYQGTDVDTILIRSDNETSKGNRSYNYRVCMMKQDAEMDMRGRCSAGQRVLACIIIRLALAECFGVNCGLIALDEPTTNLDRDNIRSLADSLHEIINARRGQSNFQLIVITHDEDFLRYMRCSDFCENYFRVQRNDRQKSEIWRNSIADVI